ncbi:MAG: cbb3-type cytochrome oxidase assembly protein CcoS [Bdellovibrionales bacterium]
MTIIYLMIPCTLLLVGGFVAAFIWANNNDQFEDLVTPA